MVLQDHFYLGSNRFSHPGLLMLRLANVSLLNICVSQGFHCGSLFFNISINDIQYIA